MEIVVKKVLTWANAITFGRFILIMPYLVLLDQGAYDTALVLALLIIAADKLDGYVARRCRQVTTAGSVFDGVTDTLFLVSSFVVLFPREGWSLARFFVLLIRVIPIPLNLYFMTVQKKIFLPKKTVLNKVSMGAIYLLLVLMLLQAPGSEAMYVAAALLAVAYAGALLVDARFVPLKTAWKN